jgi:hypothetical protein
MSETKNSFDDLLLEKGEVFNFEGFTFPEMSEWQGVLGGSLYFRPEKGKEPNRFQRWMLDVFFGIKWSKLQ